MRVRILHVLDATFCVFVILGAHALACGGGDAGPAPLDPPDAAAPGPGADAAPAPALDAAIAPGSSSSSSPDGAPACPPPAATAPAIHALFAMTDGGFSTTTVPRYHLAEDGDSIVANGYLSATQVSFASLAAEIAGTDLQSTLIATSGITMAECDARFASTVVPALATGGPKKIVLINAGTNDLKTGATPAATFAHLAHYCAQARAAHLTTIVVGLLPAMWTTDAVNDAYRDLERASAPGTCDFYVEPDARFQQDLDTGHHPSRLWTWTFDGVHPNAAGEWLQALQLLPVLELAVIHAENQA